MGFRSPPLPTKASKESRLSLFSVRIFLISSFLHSNWSMTFLKLLMTDASCLSVKDFTSLLSSKIPIFVDVDPGLMISSLFINSPLLYYTIFSDLSALTLFHGCIENGHGNGVHFAFEGICSGCDDHRRLGT